MLERPGLLDCNHNALCSWTPTDNSPFGVQVVKHPPLTACTCLTCSDCHICTCRQRPLAPADPGRDYILLKLTRLSLTEHCGK